MKILVTGAQGFIGKNLIATLNNEGYNEIFEFDRDTADRYLLEYTRDCEFIFHLAGVNRPQDENEFMEGNYAFTCELLKALKTNNNKSPILITSSIQAEKDNPYGISKKAGEDVLLEYSKKTGVKVHIFRLPNVFGKWCRPNYNSVVATFCHNIARGLDIQINDPNTELTLCYIDDVIKEFIKVMEQSSSIEEQYGTLPTVYKVTVGKIAELIVDFKNSRKSLQIPNMAEEFTKNLYSTYLSYLPREKFSYPLIMNHDHRGSFTEFIKSPERGQVSVNVSKPGITKGNHWHHTKNEKFLVVSGEGLIRFRRIDNNEIIEYRVSGEKYEVIDIPPGYTHSIMNLGDKDLVTLMWANEIFNQENPDTYYLEV